MESAAKDQVVPVCENLGLELFRRKLCRDDFMTPEVVSAFVAPSSSVRLVATRRQYAAVVVGGNEVHLCKHTSASVDFLATLVFNSDVIYVNFSTSFNLLQCVTSGGHVYQFDVDSDFLAPWKPTKSDDQSGSSYVPKRRKLNEPESGLSHDSQSGIGQESEETEQTESSHQLHPLFNVPVSKAVTHQAELMGVSDIGSHLLLYGGSKTPLGMYDFEAEDLRAILSTSEDSASSAVSHAVFLRKAPTNKNHVEPAPDANGYIICPLLYNAIFGPNSSTANTSGLLFSSTIGELYSLTMSDTEVPTERLILELNNEKIVSILPYAVAVTSDQQQERQAAMIVVIGSAGSVYILSTSFVGHGRLVAQKLHIGCSSISQAFVSPMSLFVVNRGVLMECTISATIQSEDKTPPKLLISFGRPKRTSSLRAGIGALSVDPSSDKLAAVCFDGNIIIGRLSSLHSEAPLRQEASQVEMSVVLEQLAGLSTKQARLNARETTLDAALLAINKSIHFLEKFNSSNEGILCTVDIVSDPFNALVTQRYRLRALLETKHPLLIPSGWKYMVEIRQGDLVRTCCASLDSSAVQWTIQMQKFQIDIPMSNNSYHPIHCISSLVYDLPLIFNDPIKLPPHVQIMHREVTQASEEVGKLGQSKSKSQDITGLPLLEHPSVLLKLAQHMPSIDLRVIKVPREQHQFTITIAQLRNAKGEDLSPLRILLGSKCVHSSFNSAINVLIGIIRADGQSSSYINFSSHLGDTIGFQVSDKIVSLESTHGTTAARKTFDGKVSVLRITSPEHAIPFLRSAILDRLGGLSQSFQKTDMDAQILTSSLVALTQLLDTHYSDALTLQNEASRLLSRKDTAEPLTVPAASLVAQIKHLYSKLRDNGAVVLVP